MKRKLKLQIAAVATVAVLVLVVWLATEPFKLSDGEQPIERRTRWIEVQGEPFELLGYATEGQTVDLPFDFSEPYVSRVTLYLIWLDDARTEPDTMMYVLFNGSGDQIIAGGGNSGQTFMTNNNLGNNENRHIENNEGWLVQVKCQEARDGYIGPAGIITIPDDGQDFTVRIEWMYFREHDPDWL